MRDTLARVACKQKLRRKFHWPHKAGDDEQVVGECQSCAQNNPTERH